MTFGLGTYGLSLAAGTLSTLSPCVLPLIPILIGSAFSAHRYGPFALAAGLALSFSVVGVLIATVGSSLGIDPSVVRTIAAVFLMIFGAIMLSSRLQEKFALATSGASGAGQNLLSRFSFDSLQGQLMLGLLLGIVWSPCVGPTLGAAVTLASQGKDVGEVGLSMGLFGIGAGIPLVVLGLVSRQAMGRIRTKLLTAGKIGKQLLGGIMLLLGVLIITGGDKVFETWVLQVAPNWLVHLTTSI
jgi:cytochrome c-type biogenesis protein